MLFSLADGKQYDKNADSGDHTQSVNQNVADMRSAVWHEKLDTFVDPTGKSAKQQGKRQPFAQQVQKQTQQEAQRAKLQKMGDLTQNAVAGRGVRLQVTAGEKPCKQVSDESAEGSGNIGRQQGIAPDEKQVQDHGRGTKPQTPQFQALHVRRTERPDPPKGSSDPEESG